MKRLFGENVIKVIGDMTPDEILKMDKYEDNYTERNELKEIIGMLLNLVGE